MTVTTVIDPSWPPDRAAVGALEDLRRFLNTVNLETGQDLLDAGADIATWAPGPARRPFALDDAARHRLTRFREATRALLAATGDDRAEAIRDWGEATGEVAFRIGEDLTLEPSHAGVDGLIEYFAASVMSATVDGSWERLKVCRNPGCQWSFFDRSRSKTGAWCSMEVCGARTKMRNYRSRSREGREAES